MFPIAHSGHDVRIDFADVQQKGKHLFLPNLNCAMQPDIWDTREMTGFRNNAFGNDGVDMGAPMNEIDRVIEQVRTGTIPTANLDVLFAPDRRRARSLTAKR